MRVRRSHKLLFLIVSIFIFSYFTAGKKFLKFFSETKKDYQYLTLFSEIASKTKSDYYEEVKPGEKFPHAYSAMLGYVDKTCAYLDARRTKLYELYRTGNFYSTGIYGAVISNYFHISDVVKGSPAEKAGLAPGDIIKAVGGESMYSLPFYQMYLSLLSDKTENIEIIVYKKISKETVKVHLPTELLESKTRITTITDDILLVEIPRFDQESAACLKANLPHANRLKLIIDLRNYSGGDFESFLEITKIFFNEAANFAVTLEKKNTTDSFPVGAKDALDYRAVVIVNKSTIMYGELLAALFQAAGQDKKYNITIIGRKTPGLVAKLLHIKFEDGSSILLSAGFFFIQEKPAAKSGVIPQIDLPANGFDDVIDRCKTILNEGPTTE